MVLFFCNEKYFYSSPLERNFFIDIQAIKEGKSKEQARFHAADPRAKNGALISVFSGVIKGMMKQGVAKMTGSASDSVLTRIVQDFLEGREGIDKNRAGYIFGQIY